MDRARQGRGRTKNEEQRQAPVAKECCSWKIVPQHCPPPAPEMGGGVRAQKVSAELALYYQGMNTTCCYSAALWLLLQV